MNGICPFSPFPLLPYPFKVFGYILGLSGIACAILFFWAGMKPAFLEIKVFAIYSSYFESRTFSLEYNNIREEITGILLLAGLLFMSLSKEKQEKDYLNNIRTKALWLSFIFSMLISLFSFLFIFGIGFIYAMSLQIFMVPLLYNLIFAVYRRWPSRKRTDSSYERTP